MRHVSVFGLASLFGLSLSSSALAAACSLSGYVVSPDLTTYSVPGLGLAAFDGVPDGCDLAMPIQTGGNDEVSLFSASYSGELTDSTGGRLTVTHNGISDVTDLVGQPGGSFGELAIGQVFARGNTLNSTFKIEVTNAVGSDEFDLDTADYVLESKANLFDLSSARTALATHLNGTADLLTGAGQPVEDTDSLSLLGGLGSITLGVTGQKHLKDGFLVRGGVAYVDQTTAGATTSGVMLSGAVRSSFGAGQQSVQPFVEAGVNVVPMLGMTLGLTFTTQTTTLLATANATGSYLSGYLKGGVLVAPSTDDNIIFSASLAADWLGTSGISLNPGGAGFTVNQAAQTGLFNSLHFGADWTHRFTPTVSGTLTGAIGRTIALSPVSSAIPGAGTFSTSGGSENFVQYGARANYALTDTSNLSAFVFGTTGELSGTHVQAGGTARINF